MSQSKKEARVVGIMIPNTSSLSPYPVRKMVQSEMSFTFAADIPHIPKPTKSCIWQGT